QLPRVPEWWISRNDFAGLDDMFKRTARRGTFTATDIAVLKEAMRQPGALTASINYYRANVMGLLKRRGSEDSSSAGGGRVRVPTLFIYGERDFAIIPDTVRGVERYVDAPYREVRLANSNHWVQQESPTEVNAALLSFLEE
ncbi:MAG: alpha/beta hydrolase, partial [Acidobacteriota bacterium]|nr:alpha/beta hydrolase [Acidobacteriota bacterium]